MPRAWSKAECGPEVLLEWLHGAEPTPPAFSNTLTSCFTVKQQLDLPLLVFGLFLLLFSNLPLLIASNLVMKTISSVWDPNFVLNGGTGTVAYVGKVN